MVQARTKACAALVLSLLVSLSGATDLRVVSKSNLERTGYLITVDRNAPRAINAAKVLQRSGFTVVAVTAIPAKSKRRSCRLTMSKALKLLIAADDEWGYIFQEDIARNEWTTTLPDIVNYEKADPDYVYLGVCMDWHGTPPSISSHHHSNEIGKYVVACGKCAHAQGVSKQGAKKILSWFKQQDDAYTQKANSIAGWDKTPEGEAAGLDDRSFDAPVMKMCLKHGGYPVVKNSEVSPWDRSHRGLFYQDRKEYPTTIDATKKSGCAWKDGKFDCASIENKGGRR